MKTIDDVGRIVQMFRDECAEQGYQTDDARQAFFNLEVDAIYEMVEDRYGISPQDVDKLPGARPIGLPAERAFKTLCKRLEETKQIAGYDYR